MCLTAQKHILFYQLVDEHTLLKNSMYETILRFDYDLITASLSENFNFILVSTRPSA